MPRSAPPCWLQFSALGILFTFASISAAAHAGTTSYVFTGGNDSNPGTLAAPWLTIQHAANTVKVQQ